MKRYETFEKLYQPIEQGGGSILLETYGNDLEKVRKTKNENLWTLLDCDGKLIIASGYHFVNRLNYIVTKKPCKSEFEEYRY